MNIRLSTFLSSLLWMAGVGCSGEVDCMEGFYRGADGVCLPDEPLVDTASLDLPDSTQEFWSWDVEGEAQVEGLETTQARWEGSSTWTYRNVDTEEVLCVFEMETRGFGQHPACEEAANCDWAFWVEHKNGETLQGDCAGWIGLEEEVSVAIWPLGFSAQDSEASLIYWNSCEAAVDAEQWLPVGTGSLDSGLFSYRMETMEFFVFKD